MIILPLAVRLTLTLALMVAGAAFILGVIEDAPKVWVVLAGVAMVGITVANFLLLFRMYKSLPNHRPT